MIHQIRHRRSDWFGVIAVLIGAIFFVAAGLYGIWLWLSYPYFYGPNALGRFDSTEPVCRVLPSGRKSGDSRIGCDSSRGESSPGPIGPGIF